MVGVVGSHRRRNRRRCRRRRHIGRRCRRRASLLHGTARPPSAALAPPPVASASAPVVALRQIGLPPVNDRSGVTLNFGARPNDIARRIILIPLEERSLEV